MCWVQLQARIVAESGQVAQRLRVPRDLYDKIAADQASWQPLREKDDRGNLIAYRNDFGCEPHGGKMMKQHAFRSLTAFLLGCSIVGCQQSTPSTADAARDDSVKQPIGHEQTTEVAVQEDQQVVSRQTSSRGNALTFASSPFGQLEDGRDVTMYTCTNAYGFKLKMIDWGATVVSLETGDRNAKLANVTLGYETLDGYLNGQSYFGSTVGRFCNRIAGGKFSIDGQQYTLATNDGDNHLHGGEVGLSRALWTAKELRNPDSIGVRFSYRSPDGEDGYPGNLLVTADYVLTNDNELRVELMAETDKATPVNLTNHCYWNLGGAGSGNILNHELIINAAQYLAVNDKLIPTGDLADVAGTPLDFGTPKNIGAHLEQIEADPQGYDHCFVLRKPPSDPLGTPRVQDGRTPNRLPPLAARVKDPKSGRVMEVYTTQPGLQFYSGNFLDGGDANAGNKQHEAFCLETQHFPDAPNQPAFPSTILRPGVEFRQLTVHRFLFE